MIHHPMKPFVTRRSRLLKAMTPGSLAIFPSAPVTLRNNDVEQEYRQDSDFFYLTGFDEPEAVLVLLAGPKKNETVLFLRPRNAERERWDGARLGVEGAKDRLGVDAAYAIDTFEDRLPALLRNRSRLYVRLGQAATLDRQLLTMLEHLRARSRRGATWPTEVVEPAVLVHEMRLHKSSYEIKRMRRAAEITRDAHLEAMRLAAPGRHEYEVDARLREVFRRHGSERVAYAPIVGGGANATILHYRQNQQPLNDGDLLLIDAGCEYDYYACDVTRTFPVSGQFSRPQRQIYELVLAAQLAGIAASVPGKTLEDVHQATVHVLVDGLRELGLLKGDRAKILKKKTYKPFYMHRAGHYLGMDVHDVGTYFAGKKYRPLEAGMVITVEPGLYFDPDDKTVPRAYRGIGVRIEDDVHVTEGGPDVLTYDIPKTVADVEQACSA